MEDRVSLFLFVLAGIAGFGLVGVVFGGLAGGVAQLNGVAGAAFVGRLVVDALNRVRTTPLDDFTAAVLRGSVDGGGFLGAVGAVVAFALAAVAGEPGSLLVGVLFSAAALAGVAALFGLLSYALSQARGTLLVGVVCISSLAGAVTGAAVLRNEAGILPGTAVGAVVGLVAGTLTLKPPRPPADEP